MPLKPFIFALCLAPLAWLLWKSGDAGFGANPVETVNRFLGDWALRFLLITLTVTPLRYLSGRAQIMRYRRMLGLFAFFYAILHLSNYIAFEQSFIWADIWADVLKRRYITIGMLTLLMLIPLAATSTKGMIKRLGAASWKRLHKLVYAAAIGGVLHYAMMVKADLLQPLIHAAILAALLGYRIVKRMRHPRAQFAALFVALLVAAPVQAKPLMWSFTWPDTDFSKRSIDLDEIRSGGPGKDGIPAIDKPKFKPIAAINNLTDKEPVVGLTVNGVSKAYPLRILTWHEIVNDTLGGVPVTVTFCPLCNSSIVFDRRVDGKVLDFGTTGKLRNSDLVMYDRQSESWWQQFLGEAIVGEMTGKTLTMIPSRLESFANFKKRTPAGLVLVPSDPGQRRYGDNPYVGYDSERFPFLYNGDMPKGVMPMARVVAVGDQAWPLELLSKQGVIEKDGLVISWTKGQNSALDAKKISKGKDVGNVTVQKDGKDMVHDITFAFVFHAFRPKGVIHLE